MYMYDINKKYIYFQMYNSIMHLLAVFKYNAVKHCAVLRIQSLTIINVQQMQYK
jgi:hypothetical protein